MWRFLPYPQPSMAIALSAEDRRRAQTHRTARSGKTGSRPRPHQDTCPHYLVVRCRLWGTSFGLADEVLVI